MRGLGSLGFDAAAKRVSMFQPQRRVRWNSVRLKRQEGAVSFAIDGVTVGPGGLVQLQPGCDCSGQLFLARRASLFDRLPGYVGRLIKLSSLGQSRSQCIQVLR